MTHLHSVQAAWCSHTCFKEGNASVQFSTQNCNKQELSAGRTYGASDVQASSAGQAACRVAAAPGRAGPGCVHGSLPATRPHPRPRAEVRHRCQHGAHHVVEHHWGRVCPLLLSPLVSHSLTHSLTPGCCQRRTQRTQGCGAPGPGLPLVRRPYRPADTQPRHPAASGRGHLAVGDGDRPRHSGSHQGCCEAATAALQLA